MENKAILLALNIGDQRADVFTETHVMKLAKYYDLLRAITIYLKLKWELNV